MSMHLHFGPALEYVKDIDEARRFYVDVMGLKVARQHAKFVQFDDFAIASDEAMGSGRERELYWLVDDAEAAFAELSRRAAVTMPIKQLPFGKVFGLQGPAGQPCYLLEFAKNRPSEAL
jgi:catechol 2,3-dioxygenase-like lactoylglutathione lyase family enzyme